MDPNVLLMPAAVTLLVLSKSLTLNEEKSTMYYIGIFSLLSVVSVLITIYYESSTVG